MDGGEEVNFEILEVGEPQGIVWKNVPLDNRLYEIVAVTEDDKIIRTEVPVCFTKKSIKIHLENCLKAKKKNVNVKIKVGDKL